MITLKTVSTKLMMSIAYVLIFFCLLTGTSNAQSITSHQTPNANGVTVTLLGSGFAANENISLQVMHRDNTRYIEVTPWIVTTDANGTFQTTRNITGNANDPIANLKVTANARSSGARVQYFLDGVTPMLVGKPKTVALHKPVINSPVPPPSPSEFLIDCTGTPNPGNTLTTLNPVCGNVDFTLSLQNSGGPGVTYQWQKNTGGGFVDITGATDPTFTTTQTVGTNYQCIVTCTNSGLFTASSNLLVSMSNPASCPLTVNPGGTATEIAQKLLGSGVSVSNATLNCTSNAYGTFTGGQANFGLSEGIILTSGSAVDLIGPNNSWFQSTPNYMPGDTDLSILSGNATFDACWISFDFVPTCDSVVFDYVFGSEEYPEYVNSQFNDDFAFFISGPGIVGTQNIALVPGALIPIAINNVNDGWVDSCAAVLPGPCMNCQYYVNNCEGSLVQYDGYTTVLAATSAVTAGQTYHLKITIADASDYVYDSGVMLESKSFSCVSTAVVEPDAFRGCQNGVVRFCRSGSTANPQTVHFTIGGTAVNGVDYNTIADSVVIPAGQQCTLLEIVPTVMTTGVTKTVVLTTDLAVLTVNISDGLTTPISVSVDPYCGFSTITASGADTYTWSPAEGLSATTGAVVIAAPSVQTTYTVIGRITASGCADTTSVTVDAGLPPDHTYYRDADGDTYGNPNESLATCLTTPPAGYVIDGTDCDDANSAVHPGATEICGNNIDDNCNGQIDENCGGVCPITTDLTNDQVTSTTAMLSWEDVEEAAGYVVRYGIAGVNEPLYKSSYTNSRKLTDLEPGTKYMWQVRTFCDAGNPHFHSVWSEKQTFTTLPLKVDESSFMTFDVYPNPFESNATISFNVAEDSRVEINVYDLTGKLMVNVLNENVAAGNHVVELPRNGLKDGVYFLKLSYNGEVMIKKVVIE